MRSLVASTCPTLDTGAARHRLCIVLLLTALSLAACSPRVLRGTVSGGNAHIAGAVVRLRASDRGTETDAQGNYTVTVPIALPHQVVSAWAEGYYPAGADLSTLARSSEGDAVANLALKPYPTADDPSYQWLTSKPDPNVALGCGHCMTAYAEWKGDAHALSATNPRFLSIYNGTDLAGRPAPGPGFRLDSPQDPGNCANCHAPAAALGHNGSADMNDLSGVETEGVFCDLCHKIGGVSTDGATGLPYQNLPGVQAFRLYRPAAGTQIFFGTLDDIPRRVSYSALEKESRLCAPCHSGGWWGVPAYASYDEWLASPYAAEGVTCQACHMPQSGKTTILTSPCAPAKPDPAVSPDQSDLLCRARACVECHSRPAGDPARNPLADFTLIPARPPQTIQTHRMTGVRDEAFMRASVAMTVTATQGTDGVLVDVAITNAGAGHDIPTDSPMRNMILVVTARDADGQPLPYLGHLEVPDWGGLSRAADAPQSLVPNYGGLPGKGFAKVLQDYEGNVPAPQWRNGVRINADTRIAARATDRSRYPFAAPAGGQPAVVEARLVFRRAFKAWMDAKGWNEADLVLAESTVPAAQTGGDVLAGLAPVYNTKLFSPSQATIAGAARLSPADFDSPQTCAACHAGPAPAWTGSGHARAATAPFYRAWFKAAGQDTQGQIGPFCAGCHAPVGLLTGQIRSRWAWSGRDIYPLDEAAEGGVTCDVCHSIVATTGSSNAGYVLDATGETRAGVPSPPEPSVARHAAFLAGQRALIRSAEFCAPCHEATNPGTGQPVMTTYSEWQRSRFNTGDRATARTCQGCHFAGGRHGGLRPEDLKAAASVEILPLVETAPGNETELRVRVTNTGAGHDLPTGAAELRKVWLTVAVTDAAGRLIFSSGEADPYGDPVEGSMTYGVTWQDAAGDPTDRLWEATKPSRDHRIPAGGVVTETYHFPMPADAQRPLHIRATLNYRSSSGYLSSLMTIYLGDTMPPAPVIEMAAAETTSN